jgi:hypothetical protein
VDPWDVGSAIHSRVSAEHVWDVPTESYRAVDMDDAFPGDGATSCEENQVQGTDFVIAFDKAEDDTLVSVVVEPSDDPFDQLTVEVRTSCDPRGDPSPPLACDTELRGGDTNPGRGPRRYTVAAPRGPLYVWLANVTQSSDSLGARVRIEEHEDTPGSSCDNAIALPAGDDRDRRDLAGPHGSSELLCPLERLGAGSPRRRHHLVPHRRHERRAQRARRRAGRVGG